MNFPEEIQSLPIFAVLKSLKDQIRISDTTVLSAEPGAGKSTIVPLALLDAPYLSGKKIIVLEPRRIAVKSIANRLAELLGEPVGKTVGYRIRFERKISKETRIEIVTEGILTRQLQEDNSLENVGLVVFDEFHERNLHADVALALCRESQSILRPDLKILIMSATLDEAKITTLLSAPLIKSKGRQFPIHIKYGSGSDLKLLPEIVASTVEKASKEVGTGDILVFLPGNGEILKTQEKLRRTLPSFEILPLYGALDYGKQKRAIEPIPGTRKVVLATNIAETSLTIKGIKVVVDSGYSRTSIFDPNSGLTRLATVFIDKDSADQRAGRAGRLGEGYCYRLWSIADHERMNEYRKPELETADLTKMVLDLNVWGVSDISKMDWLSPPPKSHLISAEQLLEDLEAIVEGHVTSHGREMNKLPSHPRIAHMLIKSNEFGDLNLATDIAAILEEKDPLEGKSGIDINERIYALRRYRETGRNDRFGRFKKIEEVASWYRKIFGLSADNTTVDPYETGLCLVYAFPERIASSRKGNNAQFMLSNGRIAFVGKDDDLAHESWLAVANVDAREGLGKIHLASPLNPEDLLPMIKEKSELQIDKESGAIKSLKKWLIGSIVLREVPQKINEESLQKLLCQQINKNPAQFLNLDADFDVFLKRIGLYQSLYPPQSGKPTGQAKEENEKKGNGFGKINLDSLVASAEEWIGPYLTGIKNTADLKKINLSEITTYFLGTAFMKELNQKVPESVSVPTGSNIKIEYREPNLPPILAVRIQEVFGLSNTPSIDGGKTKLLMHLLSPGYKPVQVTDDLQSFWANTYFEVKKELKRRYPKHYWPEDPLIADPINGVKKRKNPLG